MSWIALDPQGLEAVGNGLLWVSLVATLGWAAGVVLQGVSDARAHWEAMEAKKRRLEYLREAARDEALRKEVSQVWSKANGDWND